MGISRCSIPDSPLPLRTTSSLLEQLRVCRQFYREGASIFYSTSSFTFRDYRRIHRLMEAVPLMYQNSIPKLEIEMASETVSQQAWRHFLRQQLKIHFSGLREIRITAYVPTDDYGSRDQPNLSITDSLVLPKLREAKLSIWPRFVEAYSKEYVATSPDALLGEIADFLRWRATDIFRDNYRREVESLPGGSS